MTAVPAPATPMMAAVPRMLGSLSMVASRYWAYTVTVLPMATLPAGLVKLSSL